MKPQYRESHPHEPLLIFLLGLIIILAFALSIIFLKLLPSDQQSSPESQQQNEKENQTSQTVRFSF